MKIRTRYVKDVAIIEAYGKININSSKLIEEVGSILDSGFGKIIIDMEKVDFIDYNGLSVLAIAYKSAMNHKGSMKLTGISPHILELLRVVKLDDVFDIYATIDDAIVSFAGKKKSAATSRPLRRRFTRLEIDIPVHFKLTGVSRSRSQHAPLYTGRAANISGSGLFIRTINLLPPGCEVEIALNLSRNKRTIALSGVVMWLADKSLQPDFYPGMGIEFNNISHQAQEDIILYIEKNVTYKNETI